jgi:hypothetical protein
MGAGLDLGKCAIGEDNSFRILQDDNNYDTKDQTFQTIKRAYYKKDLKGTR